MKRPSKILVVADTLDLEKSSGAKGRIALLNGLSNEGFRLKVLHYSRRELHLENILLVNIPEKKNTGTYLKAKAQLIFQRITGHNINHWLESRKGFSYAHDYDVISIKAAIKNESPKDYDYILALSYASSFRAHKAILQLPEWHNKFLAYVHDPYPMHSYPRPYDWVEPGHKHKRDFFIALYTAAHKIIYPSKMLGEWMGSYYPTGKGKSVVIPHLISKDLKDTKVYPSYFEPSLFNILHAGSLMSARKPMALLKGFLALINDIPEARTTARLIMVGGHSIFHEEMKILSQEFPEIVLSPDKEDFETTYNMQQKAAINVVLEAKGPSSPFLPGKVPHCVAANKPILLLGPYYSETRRILGADYPYWSEIDDHERIKNLLKDLYQSWQREKNKFSLNRPDVQDYMSSQSIINAFKIINAR